MSSKMCFRRTLVCAVSFLLQLQIAVRGQEAGCRDGWVGHQDSCYLYKSERYNWFDAKATCEILRGHLVEINSAEENEYVGNLIHSHSDVDHPWIGLHDLEEEGVFVWASSLERPEQTYWGTGEPEDAHGEDCGGMTSSQLWFDGSCDTDNRPFVCEAERGGGIIGR